MKPFTYLLVDFLTIIVCFCFSFHPKLRFNREFISFLKASFIVAVPFIIWDVIFTRAGIWWFDESYTIGAPILSLPIEEWLFFLCIPFSCVFTYFCLDKLFNLERFNFLNTAVTMVMIAVCVATIISLNDRAYPLLTATATLISTLYLRFIAKAQWIAKVSLVYVALLPGFFLVNGVLTGSGIKSPIVNYNPAEIIGLRIGTIPIEDMVYGYTLFLLNIYFFRLFSDRQRSANQNSIDNLKQLN